MTAIDVYALPASPWKNGSGTTRTIAMHPPHASLEDFNWRVSIAEVTSEASFSQFPGVDRTILLVDGAGMMLHINDTAVPLATPFTPFTFRGEEPVRCRPLNGATRDFNVMTRRGQAQAEVRIEQKEFEADADAAVFFCPRGVWYFEDGELRSGWAIEINHAHFTPQTADAVMIAVLITNLET